MAARVGCAAVIASVLMLMGPLSALASPPSFQGLGVGTWVSDLSGDGRVAVGQSSGAFRWEAGVLSYLAGSSAKLVSQDGSVIIGSAVLTPSDEEQVRWVNGVRTPMGGLSAYQSLSWRAVSADGSVVVGTGFTGLLSNPSDALRWTNGVAQAIEDQATGLWAATDATADGNTIVGFGGGGGFRWNNGTFSPVCIDPGDANVLVLGISNDGSIMIGNRMSTYPPSPWLAATVSSGIAASGPSLYRWVNDMPEAIGEIPGGYPGVPYVMTVELSGDGSTIVGTMSPFPGVEHEPNAPTTSSIWRAGIGWRDLTDVLINECHLDVTGWQLVGIGVSDDGLTFVGNGKNPTGNDEAWIAHIPEPASALLWPCLFGLCRRCLFGVRRQRRRFGLRA